MLKEKLACDPEKFKNKSPQEISADLGYYGQEHGFSPEYLGERGVFIIGYQYLANPEKNSFFAINPYTHQPWPKDVREIFATTTPRQQQEKQGFAKLVEKIFSAPSNSFFLWLSPPDPYPLPRIYFGQIQKKNENGDFCVNAFDFNTDFNQEELTAILKTFSPSAQPKTAQDLLLEPVVIPPILFKTPQDFLEKIQQIISQKRGIEEITIHGVSFSKIKEQFEKMIWQENLAKFKSVAEKQSQFIFQALNKENYQEALSAVANFESFVQQTGGFFSPFSSCGVAVSQFLKQKFSLLGIPTSGIWLAKEPSRFTCPVCGQPLLKPVGIGECCPYCRTERRC